MSYHRDRLFNELRASKRQRCPHGAVDYPHCWNTKTREKAMREGLLEECPKCKRLPGSYWLLFSHNSIESEGASGK